MSIDFHDFHTYHFMLADIVSKKPSFMDFMLSMQNECKCINHYKHQCILEFFWVRGCLEFAIVLRKWLLSPRHKKEEMPFLSQLSRLRSPSALRHSQKSRIRTRNCHLNFWKWRRKMRAKWYRNESQPPPSALLANSECKCQMFWYQISWALQV